MGLSAAHEVKVGPITRTDERFKRAQQQSHAVNNTELLFKKIVASVQIFYIFITQVIDCYPQQTLDIYFFYFNTCTVHLLLFCTINQQIHIQLTNCYVVPKCFDTILSSSGSS